jgi:Protein of unknown function (DUF3078)
VKSNLKILVICCLSVMSVYGLVQAEDSEEQQSYIFGNWTFTGGITGAGSYTSFKDWQSGGTDATAANLMTDLSAQYAKNRITWKNTFKLEYGFTKIKDESIRKSSDLLSLESHLGVALMPKLSAYGRLSVSTSMTKGYLNYDDPIDANFMDSRESEFDQMRVQIADSFDPTNLSEGAGVEYSVYSNEDGSRSFKVKGGIGGRQLFRSNYYIEDDDSETTPVEFSPVEEYNDFGLEAGADVSWLIHKHASFTSKALGFYGFGEEFWKVEWDSSLVLNLTKHVGISLTATMLYDELVFDDPQWKTATMLTLNYRIF